MRIHARGAAAQLLLGGIHAAALRLVPRHAALLSESDGYDVAQKRQTARVERSAALRMLKLGAELPDYRAVVGVAVSVDHDERVSVRLTEQIFRLVYLVRGVDRHEHRADLRRRPEGDVPLRNVRRPDRNLVASLHAERDERAREFVDVAGELRIRPCVVERRIAESVLIGEMLHLLVEHLREREIDERLLLPYEIARAGAVLIEHLIRLARVAEAAHAADEMREDYIHVGKLGEPCDIPFEGDKAVVVYRAERVDQLVDRKLALSDEAVREILARPLGILDVDVADVRAEILYRLLGALAAESRRIVEIPERADRIAGEGVERVLEKERIREDAAGLDKDADVLLLRRADHTADQSAASLGGSRRVAALGGVYPHIRNAKLARLLYALRDVRGGSVRILRGDVAHGVDARDRKPRLVHLSHGPPLLVNIGLSIP